MDIYPVKTESVDGRTLCVLTFERETPDAAAPVIEAVFEVYVPMGMFDRQPPVLFFLAAVRKDTREPVTLTAVERAAVMDKVSEFANSMTGDE